MTVDRHRVSLYQRQLDRLAPRHVCKLGYCVLVYWCHKMYRPSSKILLKLLFMVYLTAPSMAETPQRRILL